MGKASLLLSAIRQTGMISAMAGALLLLPKMSSADEETVSPIPPPPPPVCLGEIQKELPQCPKLFAKLDEAGDNFEKSPTAQNKKTLESTQKQTQDQVALLIQDMRACKQFFLRHIETQKEKITTAHIIEAEKLINSCTDHITQIAAQNAFSAKFSNDHIAAAKKDLTQAKLQHPACEAAAGNLTIPNALADLANDIAKSCGTIERTETSTSTPLRAKITDDAQILVGTAVALTDEMLTFKQKECGRITRDIEYQKASLSSASENIKWRSKNPIDVLEAVTEGSSVVGQKFQKGVEATFKQYQKDAQITSDYAKETLNRAIKQFQGGNTNAVTNSPTPSAPVVNRSTASKARANNAKALVNTFPR